MKVALGIWGGLGLFGNIFNFLTLITWDATGKGGVGVGTSAYMGTIALIWIGGMLFFGLFAILNKTEATSAVALPPPPLPSAA